MNTFDYALLILLGLGALSGFQKGLITGLSKFIGRIASIVIAVTFYSQFLDIVEPIFHLREKIEPKISGLMTNLLESQTAGAGQFGRAEAVIQPMIHDVTVSFTDYVLNIIAFITLFFLASFIINLFISVAITPIAKDLSIVNRGGGLLFGLLSAYLILSLVIGLISPVAQAANSNLFGISDSELYPWFVSGYQLVLSIVSLFAGDILNNPLDNLPFL